MLHDKYVRITVEVSIKVSHNNILIMDNNMSKQKIATDV